MKTSPYTEIRLARHPLQWILGYALSSCLFVCVIARADVPAETPRWAQPQGFFASERIKRTPLAPGLVWISAAGVRDGLLVETQVLDVDLRRQSENSSGAQRGLWLETIAGALQMKEKSGQYFWRSTPGQMQRDTGAIAVFNASFFDIRSTQTPFGLVMRDGWLLREPAKRDHPAVLSLADGRAFVGVPGWQGSVCIENNDTQGVPLAGINRALLQEGEVALFCPPWQRTPAPQAGFLRGRAAMEIILRRKVVSPVPGGNGVMRVPSEVVAVRTAPDREPHVFASDEMALVAGPRAAGFFQNVQTGASLEIRWELTGLPAGIGTRDVRHAVAGNVFLIVAGQPQQGGGAFWTTRNPRSAVGVAADGWRALFVVADGRSLFSAGMDLATLRDYLAHLGAHEAVNLDGGGSTALVVADDGGEPRVLNRPSDGRERLIPTALGVFAR